MRTGAAITLLVILILKAFVDVVDLFLIDRLHAHSGMIAISEATYPELRW